MKTTLDTVVIGGGAMGSAAAWALARRGREVTLLEQFGPGHRNGASHGTTRNFNPGYADPDYVAMLAEAAQAVERARSGRRRAAAGAHRRRKPRPRSAVARDPERAACRGAPGGVPLRRGSLRALAGHPFRYARAAHGGWRPVEPGRRTAGAAAARRRARRRDPPSCEGPRVESPRRRRPAHARGRRPHRGAHRKAGSGHRRRLDHETARRGRAPAPADGHAGTARTLRHHR